MRPSAGEVARNLVHLRARGSAVVLHAHLRGRGSAPEGWGVTGTSLADNRGMMWRMEQGPWWAALTTWVVVNVVNVAQAVGFLSRRRHGMGVNRVLGYVIAALAGPATAALVGYARAGSPWWVGPALFDAFVALMLVVDYMRPVEFRHPRRPAILVPYLVLFFGSIVTMGVSMFDLNRGLWLVTVATSTALLASMVLAARQGTA